MFNPTNDSEKQVLEHLNVLESDVFEMYDKNEVCFRLRPQGMNTIIEKNAVNLMEINIPNGNCYIFGGITESFYDYIVNHYWESHQLINEE